MTKPKQNEVTILVQASTAKHLTDFRYGRNFFKFGNIMNVARHYGIRVQPIEGGLKCSAPKTRIQMFAEKLHFADVKYIEIN